jgi:hypothetical protein
MGSVLWLTTAAYMIFLFHFLHVVGRREPELRRRLLWPVPWTWTIFFNPVALCRILACAIRPGDGLSTEVVRAGGRLRTSAALLLVEWPLMLLLYSALPHGPR